MAEPLKCPHCGGKIVVLIPADAVDETAQWRDSTIDSIAAWSRAQAKLVRGIGLAGEDDLEVARGG